MRSNTMTMSLEKMYKLQMQYRLLEIKEKAKFREMKNFGYHNVKMVHENIREIKTRQILIVKMFLFKRNQRENSWKESMSKIKSIWRVLISRKFSMNQLFFGTIPFPVILKSWTVRTFTNHSAKFTSVSFKERTSWESTHLTVMRIMNIDRLKM